MKYVIGKNRKQFLAGFYPNGLPTRKITYSETKNRYIEKLNFSDVIKFSYSEYILFGTLEEARRYFVYMLENARSDDVTRRFANVAWYAADCLTQKISNLKIYELN